LILGSSYDFHVKFYLKSFTIEIQFKNEFTRFNFVKSLKVGRFRLLEWFYFQKPNFIFDPFKKKIQYLYELNIVDRKIA